ncbi:hypothetical protein AN458_28405 [Pseudomonas aeruginosa]|nr:hypothetical protein AN458_28405 [Pseudomonas aeruginosa]KSQ92862.1 hypothetical protein APB42_17540 [Pseudomonas aeruginosa]RPW74000.1 hypothetical protein IPC734_32340 [Pseudomonas aeruginosa]
MGRLWGDKHPLGSASIIRTTERMAKQKTIPYEEARQAIAALKVWPANAQFVWKKPATKKLPAPYSFRTSLALDIEQTTFAEDWFVELYYKKSPVPGVRDTLSITLIVNKSRVVAIDDNGPSSHMNKVGVGLPFYQQVVDHPHLHMPIAEASYGYAEPLDSTTVQALWELFLAKANITGAPRFELPEFGQMGFDV